VILLLRAIWSAAKAGHPKVRGCVDCPDDRLPDLFRRRRIELTRYSSTVSALEAIPLA
jgi:hypothetical protein